MKQTVETIQVTKIILVEITTLMIWQIDEMAN
jgi:hypothetical protein